MVCYRFSRGLTRLAGMGDVMVAQHRSSVALHGYVLAVSTAGLGALALLAAGDGATLPGESVFWVLAACLAATESLPVLMRGGTWVSTTAEAIAFAILLGWGTAPAAFALVVGLVIADVLRRAVPEKLLFNAGQYGLLMAAAGGVYHLLGGDQPFTPRELPAFAAAALAFFLGNLVLVGIVTALAYGRDFLADLKDGVRIEAWPYLMVFGMAPVLFVIVDYSVGLLPLLMLPQLAVFRALKGAVEAHEHRVAAERAAEAAEALAAEQARLAEAEHALVEKLQESDRLKDDLLATVSHELRTPLAGLLGALATLSGRSEALSPRQRKELVAMAERQGERLKELIEQLLLAARFEHARGEQGVRPAVDAAILAGQAAAAAKVSHPRRSLVLDANAALPVRAAPEALLQVLGNLLDNAAKYSPDHTPIRVEATRAGALAVLAVEDAGPGVPASERDRIFERFTQLDSGATRRAGGVGLGLYIARQLAQAQGGELLVGEPSRPGAGARFELRLPLAEEAVPKPGPAEQGQQGQAYDRPA
jgi:signal transduction histidine kinase